MKSRYRVTDKRSRKRDTNLASNIVHTCLTYKRSHKKCIVRTLTILNASHEDTCSF